MKTKADPRHSARKLALASIFCWIFSDPSLNECLNLTKDLLSCEDSDPELTQSIIDGVQKHRDEIDKIITQCAPEWPIDKISKIDLVILRVAIFEVMFGNRTPTKVAIDEAVELAKEFGNDTSSKFVNGVLGSVADLHAARNAQPSEEKKDE
ncbi:MAG TPA: transcription antitermination factor NusB [Candidatus Saccharimonadales bacterium]|nr:transcription antitermination factor NusB [Candidatus Saccharimonadales bacterium]